MISYEKNIESMYREPVYVAGGGTRRTAWDIEWQDEPFAASDTSVVSPLKLPPLMKDIWETGVPTKESAVYIHVPFCRLSCTYCAFFKKKADEREQHEYAKLLCREIDALAGRPYLTRSHIRSVFFGGGTPGILSAEDIERILGRIRTVFPLMENVEITMESSLSDMTDEKTGCGDLRRGESIQFWRTVFSDGDPKWDRPSAPREQAMERLAHFAKKDALMILDLIYGLPGETEETMRQDIRDAKACGAAGLDLYKLQLLQGAPLAKSFAKAGKTLEVPYLQALFRAAEEELGVSGASNISCTHWKWDAREESVYNTLAANGSDIFPIGMACGGKIGGLGLMKPVAEAMYRGAVLLGKFVSMGARKESRYRRIYQAIEAASDRGRISPAALETLCEVPFTALLTPLLDQWADWGARHEVRGHVCVHVRRALLVSYDAPPHAPYDPVHAAGPLGECGQGAFRRYDEYEMRGSYEGFNRILQPHGKYSACGGSAAKAAPEEACWLAWRIRHLRMGLMWSLQGTGSIAAARMRRQKNFCTLFMGSMSSFLRPWEPIPGQSMPIRDLRMQGRRSLRIIRSSAFSQCRGLSTPHCWR